MRELPRCGVAMKITTRTNGSGLTKSARCRSSRVSALTSSVVEGLAADGVPEARARVDGRHLGEQPTLAVPDHDHLLQRRIRALGVELRTASVSASRSSMAEYGIGLPVS